MNEPDVVIPEQAEYFLAFLFGKKNAHLPPYIPAKEWKSFCVRLSRHLQAYVRANVVSDREHHERIEVALSKLHEAATVTQGREAALVTALAELCLLLLGAIPDHWRKRKVASGAHFRLNEYRTVHYCQNPAQKAALIYRRYVEPRFQDPKDEEGLALYERYWDCARRHKDDEFIAYFRSRFEKESVALFV